MRALLPGRAPPLRGSQKGGRLFGVFALVKHAVGDLTQLAGIVGERSNVAPINVIGTGVEMLAAEALQARQHRIDVDLGGEEGRKGLGIVFGGSVGHGFVSAHRFAAV
jgi:hypothetical protein